MSPSRRVAWWHCFSGIAGDMALASLVDAGADLEAIERELVALPFGGWSLESRPVQRGGLAATQMVVTVRDTPVVRTHAHIVGLITEARLDDRVRRRALAAFAALAEVEGRLHGRPPSQVHFHEVGGTDAIIDIVGTCVALEVLGVDEVRSSAVAQGSGMVRSSHGLLPVPAPAVVELLAGAPTYGTDVPVELTTPTGAALLASLAEGWGPMPEMRVERVGRGAGSRELAGRPNLVQVVLGEAIGGSAEPGHPIVLLETNLDDVTGEVLAHAVAALLGAGALDAWVTPIVGKKGRPAHQLSVVVEPAAAGRLLDLVVAETGTLGVRVHERRRWTSTREVSEVEVEGYTVRVKSSPAGVKAEHEDLARVARLLGRPLRQVAKLVEAASEPPAPGGGPLAPPSPEAG
ncbi:MAG: nickel pincer cofactor biosynthesis protein LarC [Actinomycetota bacterium]|nr:nickel pincer cofactor biosynthesis protein LarC [Actinomycetota bacterium]